MKSKRKGPTKSRRSPPSDSNLICRAFAEECWQANVLVLFPKTGKTPSAQEYTDCILRETGMAHELEGPAGGRCLFYSGAHVRWIILLIHEFDWDIQDMVILSHECLHGAVRLLEESGMGISVANDEALCYLHSELYQRTLRIIFNENKPIKRPIKD